MEQQRLVFAHGIISAFAATREITGETVREFTALEAIQLSRALHILFSKRASRHICDYMLRDIDEERRFWNTSKRDAYARWNFQRARLLFVYRESLIRC